MIGIGPSRQKPTAVASPPITIIHFRADWNKVNNNLQTASRIKLHHVCIPYKCLLYKSGIKRSYLFIYK